MSLVVRRADALSRRTSSGVAVLGIAASRPTLATGPAVAVWELLADPISIEALIGQTARRHAMTPAAVRADVVRLVEAWERDQAIERLP